MTRYDQSKYAPNLSRSSSATIQQQWRCARASATQTLQLRRRPRFERLEVYSTKRPNAPIHIHIHGGPGASGRRPSMAFPPKC